MVNHTFLSTCPRSVILCFRAVTPLCQVSLPWAVSDFLGDPGAFVQVGSPPQSVSSAWGTLWPKLQPACLLLAGCDSSQTSSDKANWGHLGCYPPMSSSVPFWTPYSRVNRRNVCAWFERFSAEYLHLNPPPLAITSCTWELAGITGITTSVSFFSLTHAYVLGGCWN